MGIVGSLFLSVALAMDAMAVTLSNTLCVPNTTKQKKIAMVFLFGAFQGVMPIIGYFLGASVATHIDRFGGIGAFLILGFIGVSMLLEGIREIRDPGLCDFEEDTLSYSTLLVQAVATSIDALIVGVSIALTGTPLFSVAVMIGVVTALFCALVIVIGEKLGAHFGTYAKCAGGIILILIGIKALI